MNAPRTSLAISALLTFTTLQAHNMAWGDEGGKTLYLCAQSGLYKMRLNIEGVRP